MLITFLINNLDHNEALAPGFEERFLRNVNSTLEDEGFVTCAIP